MLVDPILRKAVKHGVNIDSMAKELGFASTHMFLHAILCNDITVDTLRAMLKRIDMSASELIF